MVVEATFKRGHCMDFGNFLYRVGLHNGRPGLVQDRFDDTENHHKSEEVKK